MFKTLLLIPLLAFEAAPFSQPYFGNPAFQDGIPNLPKEAHIEGWGHGTIKTNGIGIDLSIMKQPRNDTEELSESRVRAWSDHLDPAHAFHFDIEYPNIKLGLGYDLQVRPYGTDQIECVFTSLTGPKESPDADSDWRPDVNVTLIKVPSARMVIRNGGIISFTTYPLADGKYAVVHYLQLKRDDLHTVSAE